MKSKFNLFEFIVYLIGGVSAGVIGFCLPFLIDPINRFPNLKFEKGSYPRFFIVQSGSMEPAIKTGSLVITYPNKTYFEGDVVTFQSGKDKDSAVTHRIVDSAWQYDSFLFTTAGDANEEQDSAKVAQDKIVGKVYLTLPYFGYLANYAKGPKGFIFLVIVPATIIIYEEIKFLFKEIISLIKKLIRKIRRQTTPSFIHPKSFAIPRLAVIVPLAGAAIFLIAFSSSYFSADKNVKDNLISSWGELEKDLEIPIKDTFSTVTSEQIEVTPTPTETPLPTDTPTPTLKPPEKEEVITITSDID